MILSGIAALAANRVIGKNGDLPWRLPEDLKFFRDKTKGRAMIMGRKTFESLPGGKPLPGRFHIVISRNPEYRPVGAVAVTSLDAAINEASLHRDEWGDETFVIGGGEIFALAMPHLNRLYLTELAADFEGDAYFPKWDRGEFKEMARLHRDLPMRFDFVLYERRV